jgi:Tfp pilus assembly protein PilF
VLGLLLLIGLGGYISGVHIWAEWHYRQAERALQRRDFTTAQAHLAQCLTVRRNSPDVHLLAARTARRAGAYSEAERYLSDYRRLGGVPEALDLERALLLVQRGEVARFENYLWDCVQKDHPDSVLLLEALTWGYMKTFRLPEAAQSLQVWLERDPDDVQALLWHAEVAERRQQHPQALDDYRRVLELQPERDATRLRLAELLVTMHQSSDALPYFEELHARQPDNSAVLRGMARCRWDLGQVEEARQLLDTLLASRPHDVEGLYEQGRLALQLGRSAEAEDRLRQAVAQAPHHYEANFALYQCLQMRGKQEESAKQLAEVERLQAQLAKLTELTKKIGERPSDAALRCEVGLIFLDTGQDQEGLRWLASALQEDPTHRPTHAALAAYYQRTGDNRLATHHRRQAGQ